MGDTLCGEGECGWVERDWEKLRKWTVRRRLEGLSVAVICGQAGIRRKVFYFWWNRYLCEGWQGLEEKRRGRPKGPELDNALKVKAVKLIDRSQDRRLPEAQRLHRRP